MNIHRVIIAAATALFIWFISFFSFQHLSVSVEMPPVVPIVSVAEASTTVVIIPGQQTIPTAQKSIDGRPRRITIPSIDLNREIIDVGVTSTNNLDVPPNFTQVGWYKYGHVPGEEGSTVLDGHVDNGGYVAGPFKQLKNVKIGDLINVTVADGRTFTYKVVSSKVFLTSQFPGDFVFHDDSGSLLKIITCHGTFAKSMDTYDHRLIVTAELVK